MDPRTGHTHAAQRNVNTANGSMNMNTSNRGMPAAELRRNATPTQQKNAARGFGMLNTGERRKKERKKERQRQSTHKRENMRRDTYMNDNNS